MMPNKTRFLRLRSLVAYLQSESNGDEIYIKYKDKKIAPVDTKFYKMPQGPLELNIEIELDKSDEWVELELWDYDVLSPNDFLGNFKLMVDELSEDFTAELIRTEDPKARYVLNWAVIERLNNSNKSA
jgi:hypothetical protein